MSYYVDVYINNGFNRRVELDAYYELDAKIEADEIKRSLQKFYKRSKVTLKIIKRKK